MATQSLPSELLTTTEVAELLDVDSRTVQRWCAKGLLTAREFGRAWLICREDFERFQKPKAGRPRSQA